jgi:hypothetical protein
MVRQARKADLIRCRGISLGQLVAQECQGSARRSSPPLATVAFCWMDRFDDINTSKMACKRASKNVPAQAQVRQQSALASRSPPASAQVRSYWNPETTYFLFPSKMTAGCFHACCRPPPAVSPRTLLVLPGLFGMVFPLVAYKAMRGFRSIA